MTDREDLYEIFDIHDLPKKYWRWIASIVLAWHNKKISELKPCMKCDHGKLLIGNTTEVGICPECKGRGSV